MDKEQEVRLIAYKIWEEESCPDGKDCDHWLRAETLWEARNKPKAKKPEAKPANPKKQSAARKK